MIQWKKYLKMRWKKILKIRCTFNEESGYSEENTSDNEAFCCTIFQPFQFEPEQEKKLVVMRTMRKLNWCKFGHWKNEAREIDCNCCREVDAILITWLKSQSSREASHHLAYIGNCRTISHMRQPYLPYRWVLLFVPGVAEQNVDAGVI